jgi:hypothetical protein
MNALTLFGLVSVTAMLVCYTLEKAVLQLLRIQYW